jgi:hypothetical protein
MTDSVEQRQKGGDDSTNVQAGQIVIHQHGLTYNDVKEIALDVFKSNFEQLSQVAKEAARARAEEITDEFLKQLRERNPHGLSQAETPQFQLNLFTAQKEYARTGDKEVGNLLVDLLIDITRENERSVVQIVLEECLTVAPKLTAGQIASLAVIFLFKYSRHRNANTPVAFRTYCELASPFVELISEKDTTYRHLEYSGCGAIGIGEVQLGSALAATYPVVFSRPFTTEELQSAAPELIGTSLVMPSASEHGKFQFTVASERDLEELFPTTGLDLSLATKVRNFLRSRQFTLEEIKEKTIEWVPNMARVFDVWNASGMKNFSLTSVGLGIAHAAVRSKTGFSAGLSTWVN